LNKKIVVGLSGGVDSAIAAWLLKEQGYEVTGVFMKNWEDDDDESYCSSREDLIDAVSVAETLGIEIETVNFSKEYRDRVFNEFLDEYARGRTPNPDVFCNSEIKFKAFLDHAIQLGADKIATGHYAQLRERSGLFELLKAEDGTKDQSYFLYRLNQDQLSKTLFPLGNMYKREVRAIAKRLGLGNHNKKDSTGICFIGERRFKDFLGRYLPDKPGNIITPEGQTVGSHQGLMFHTIGQRQGLGIGGDGLPWYVSKKDMATNTLTVVQGHDHPLLQNPDIYAQNLHWISGNTPSSQWVFGAKSRYRQKDAACTIKNVTESMCHVQFAEPQWAVTPGQSLVVYESNVCLGGGVISDLNAQSHNL
jgi:tRNA-specific 2-thiouridylase|tara:strand:+ start:6737 stop:7825 length:1089 start_codon:yes stop_codon:yes gene_type:complete